MRLLLVLILGLSLSAFAQSELDDETGVINAESGFSGTVIIRIDERNNSVARLAVESDLEAGDAAEGFAVSNDGDFETVPSDLVVSELDQDSGQSSWYYYWGYNYGYNYGYYWHSGRYYRPYYSYSYRYYTYYYYNRYWW